MKKTNACYDNKFLMGPNCEERQDVLNKGVGFIGNHKNMAYNNNVYLALSMCQTPDQDLHKGSLIYLNPHNT